MDADTQQVLDLLERIRAYIVLGYWDSAEGELRLLEELIDKQRGW